MSPGYADKMRLAPITPLKCSPHSSAKELGSLLRKWGCRKKMNSQQMFLSFTSQTGYYIKKRLKKSSLRLLHFESPPSPSPLPIRADLQRKEKNEFSVLTQQKGFFKCKKLSNPTAALLVFRSLFPSHKSRPGIYSSSTCSNSVMRRKKLQ